MVAEESNLPVPQADFVTDVCLTFKALLFLTYSKSLIQLYGDIYFFFVYIISFMSLLLLCILAKFPLPTTCLVWGEADFVFSNGSIKNAVNCFS